MPHVPHRPEDLVRHASEALIAIDTGKRILSMNPSAESLTGIREADAVGHACADVVRSSICGDDCPFESAITGTRQISNFDVRLTTPSGEHLRVCINSSVLRNHAGETIGIVESVRDIAHILRLISARETAIHDVRALARRLEAVLETSTDAVIAVDLDCSVTSFNRAAEELIMRRREEILGTHARQICEAEFCPLEVTLQQGEGLHGGDLNLRLQDGSIVPVWMRTDVLRDDEGKMIGAVAIYRDQREVRDLQEQFRETHGLDRLIGRSAPMQAVFRRIERVAQTESTVLICGESGTGKELVADIIQSRGRRWDKPFVKVSCAALPESLLESELFGHVRGAFTGAVADRIGRFQLAHRGTIFLDEIGDLPPTIQVKLLRVLQEREFERVGSASTVQVDIRVIAATNRDLHLLVDEGKFREDLYYRLHVVPVDLPPLRDHAEDIPLLATAFLDRLASQFQGRTKRLTPKALKRFLDYRWPGNVRELENAIEYAVVTSDDDWIRPNDLPTRLQAISNGTPKMLAAAVSSTEKEQLLDALRGVPNSREAARRLGISRATLWRKMKRFGISFTASESHS